MYPGMKNWSLAALKMPSLPNYICSLVSLLPVGLPGRHWLALHAFLAVHQVGECINTHNWSVSHPQSILNGASSFKFSSCMVFHLQSNLKESANLKKFAVYAKDQSSTKVQIKVDSIKVNLIKSNKRRSQRRNWKFDYMITDTKQLDRAVGFYWNS